MTNPAPESSPLSAWWRHGVRNRIGKNRTRGATTSAPQAYRAPFPGWPASTRQNYQRKDGHDRGAWPTVYNDFLGGAAYSKAKQ
jgi:hypothetical protein